MKPEPPLRPIGLWGKPLVRPKRCREAGCLNYAEGGTSGLCKPCEDENVYDSLVGRHTPTPNGRKNHENAVRKRAALDAEYLELAAPPRVNVFDANRLLEEWAR